MLDEDHQSETTPPLLGATVGVTPSKFCRQFCRQNTRVPGLSYGVVCMVLHLAVLVQYRRVTDKWTDRRTHDASIFRTAVDFCGKMCYQFKLVLSLFLFLFAICV